MKRMSVDRGRHNFSGNNVKRELDEDKVEEWAHELGPDRGADIFRSKGVLSFKDVPDRVFFRVFTRSLTVRLTPHGGTMSDSTK
ncbi:MAG: hypothetical protein Ct9H300mP19_15050 [Dehalococcoidia bacterium]|nr:MAG: hypothetical protein Ct9H300mP19_15050 [Dehalococcoidia bacterium]